MLLYQKKNGNVAIEVPLILNEDINVGHKDYQELKTFNKLLLIPSKKDVGEYESFIVNILQFNSLKGFNNRSSELNYFKMPKNFDGLITVIDNKNIIVERNKFKLSKLVQLNNENKILRKDYDKNTEYTCLLYGEWQSDGTFKAMGIVTCYASGTGGINPPNYADSNPDD
ncbi:hypothetical protein EC396_09495 [Lutibacter sp. HS1-25]|nr:hypothetical protein EC396_09495 [Lutibacter sp. HS1-25]